MIVFACTGCGKNLKVPDDRAGKMARCPHCGQQARIPAAVPTPQALQRPAAPAGFGPAPLEEGEAPTVVPGGSGEPRPGPADGPSSDTVGEARPKTGHPPELTEFLAPPQSKDEIGRLGTYRVLQILGAGGMGVVYKAEDPGLQRLVALKAMLPSLGATPTARERFLREARAAAGIKHDHIVTIFQVGEDRGVPFLAMEFLEGEPLDSRLKAVPRLPIGDVLRIGREIAAGLAAAHRRGLVHRDIKPANVWLDADSGRVKILDFGLARGAEDTQLTQQGAIVGTPAYMAPEQARGETVDPRCDLFSLGCVLYRLCTGQQPFKGKDTISTLMAIATEQPRPPSALNAEVPADLSDLILRLLAKRPADRPASAQVVVDALTAIDPEGTAILYPVSPPAKKSTGVKVPPKAPPVPAPVKPKTAVKQPPRPALPPLEPRVTPRPALPQAEPAAIPRRRRWPIVVGLLLLLATAGAVAVYLHQTGGPGGSPSPESASQPISSVALVSRPTDLPGLRGWTVETIAGRGETNVLAINPKDGRLATGSGDGTIRVVEAATGHLQRCLLGHGGRVNALAWSPDGTALASAGSDKTVRVWEVATGRLRYTLEGHTDRPLAVAWSADGKTLASGGLDKVVRLWDPATGKAVGRLEGQDRPIQTLEWSPTARVLASAAQGHGVILWDPDEAKLLHHFQAGVSSWAWPAWSPNGKELATADNTSIRFWSTDTGRLLHSIDKAHASWVEHLAWSPDGKHLASTGHDQMLHIWTFVAPKVVEKKSFKGKGDPMPRAASRRGWQAGLVRSLAWSPDSKTVAWATREKVELRQVFGRNAKDLVAPGHLAGASFLALSPDGKLLAVNHDDGTVRLWDVAAAKQVRVLEGHGWRVHTIAWSPDGQRLAAGSAGRPAVLWQVATGKRLSMLGTTLDITGLLWSPDGKLLLMRRGTVLLQPWDTQAGRPLPTPAHWDDVAHLHWSPDGQTLAGGSLKSQVVHLWGPSLSDYRSLAGARGSVTAVRWSPDGKTLAGGGQDKVVRLWDPATGKVGATCEGHTGPILGLAWAPDSSALASRSDDGTARLWDSTGKSLHVLAGHPKLVGALTWSPNSKRLATASDFVVRLWDPAAGTLLHTLPGRGSFPLWASDSKTLFVSSNATTQLWDVDAGRLAWTLVGLHRGKFLAVRADGHYQGTQGIEQELVHVAQTEAGQETLSPEAFASKYNWRNEPGGEAVAGRRAGRLPWNGMRGSPRFARKRALPLSCFGKPRRDAVTS
jgi:WD40 repeat protein/serine/threonine protein kinase